MYDLPSAQAMADLDLDRTTSIASNKGSTRQRSDAGPDQPGDHTRPAYKGGDGLNAGRSRPGRTTTRMSRSEKIHEEGPEDEDGPVTAQGDESETSEEFTARMYARFSMTRKKVIVAIVAYVALLAREFKRRGICLWPRH